MQHAENLVHNEPTVVTKGYKGLANFESHQLYFNDIKP
jgi:hypothetical protein